MIGVYNVVDIISRILRKNIILHRSFKVDNKFKIYKIFQYNLFTLDKTGKRALLEWSTRKRLSELEDINSMWETCDMEYIYELLKWFKEYKDV